MTAMITNLRRETAPARTRSTRTSVLLAAGFTAAAVLTACSGSSTPQTSNSASNGASGGATGKSSIGSGKIDSVAFGGGTTDPTVTVTGSGFGAKPSPDPSSPPSGQQGCPSAPAVQGEYLYGTNFNFTDQQAATGQSNWTAGQNGNNQFDCIGVVIDNWTSSKVAFHFGVLYGKQIPDNAYYLTNGDPFQVVVRGATFSGTVSKLSPGARAKVDSLSVGGTQAAPTITVTGSGFGAEPEADPVSSPAGQMGCPPAAGSAQGHLYGTAVYFSDLKPAKSSGMWTAGQFTPGSNGTFDCVGLVLASWSDTKVVFGFGPVYGKPIKDNMYYLSNGDPVEVVVRGASAKTTVQGLG